ncbi:MAG: serine hydrolase [Cytophagales bacterium]|nr:serine hydrolase [Cytophagales bacterium]
MSFPKFLFFCISVFLFASANGAKLEDIFLAGNPTSYLSDASSRIWLDATSDTSLVRRIPSEYKGIVLNSNGLNQLKDVNQKDFIVAIRLGDQLDLPTYNLPGLATLATITDHQILRQYLEKYIQLLSRAGADYVLLPDLTKFTDPQVDVLRKLIRIDSSFFLSEDRLQTLEKVGKKQLRLILEQDGIALIKPEELPRLAKSLRKVQKNPMALSTLIASRERPDHVIIPTKLITAIYQNAVVHLSAEKSVLPIQTREIALLTNNPHGPLTSELTKYFEVRDIISQPPKYGQTIIVDARTSAEAFMPFIEQYQEDHKIIALVSSKTPTFVDADEFLYFEESLPLYDELIPQMLFGAIGVLGRNSGVATPFAHLPSQIIPSFGKLRFAAPEWEGMSSDSLALIQQLAQEMIIEHAAPGCQVTVLKGGSIVYDKSFGYLTYDSLIAVHKNIIYDVASVTKVLGTLLCVMSLEEKAMINLDDSIGVYLPQYVNSNKGHITLKQLLSHQSGLRSYEPMWKRTLKGDFLEPFSYYTAQDEEDDRRSYGYPIHPVMMDSIRSWLIQSPLLDKKGEYRYSDLGFMILQQVVESVTRMSMERYLFENFYYPMGLHYTVFNPLEKGFEIFEIAPTEFDKYYRDELVWGTVHDRNAAISGGVAGHAGLFSSSKELAILMHMVLNDGYYGGRQYLQPATINRFNQRYFKGNRRALGWDKLSESVGNVSAQVSEASFGHTGFTGTMVWADPANDLVFTFVSNRIYPEAENRRLITRDIRNRIQDVVYRSLVEE